MKKFKRPTVKKLKAEYALKIQKIMKINGLTQTELAALLGTISQNVNRWLGEVYLPSPEFRQKIDELFKTSITEEALNGKSNS